MNPIGFTTGVLYPHIAATEALPLLTGQGVTCVEIGQSYSDPSENLRRLTKDDLAPFSYVSLHATGSIQFGKNDDTLDSFARIEAIHKERPLDLVVFHPDVIEEISVFNGLPFPIAFENMDVLRDKYINVADMQTLFDVVPEAKMVLDVNHVWTIDKSMQLAHEFWDAFGDRIAEVHLSGYSKLHDPLFETGQREIIEAIEHLDVQIIVESQLASAEDIAQERTYIEQTIKEIKAACS